MDYGNPEHRRTKKDLKRKRIARGYKRGGKFRTQGVSESSEENDKGKGKSKKKKLRKY